MMVINKAETQEGIQPYSCMFYHFGVKYMKRL